MAATLAASSAAAVAFEQALSTAEVPWVHSTGSSLTVCCRVAQDDACESDEPGCIMSGLTDNDTAKAGEFAPKLLIASRPPAWLL